MNSNHVCSNNHRNVIPPLVLFKSWNDPDPFDRQFGPCVDHYSTELSGYDTNKIIQTFVARADASKIWSAEGLSLLSLILERTFDFIFSNFVCTKSTFVILTIAWYDPAAARTS